MYKSITTARREDKGEDKEMDLVPRSYQIIRQYPRLTRHAGNEGGCNDHDDDDNRLDQKNPFVRHGFGRLSTVSGKSCGENYNSVDEIMICGNVRRPSAR